MATTAKQKNSNKPAKVRGTKPAPIPDEESAQKPAEQPPERKVRSRSDIERERETMVARNRDEVPERFLGKLKCPGCHRVIEVQSRDDLETLKIHVQNRSHGTLTDCTRINPPETVRDA